MNPRYSSKYFDGLFSSDAYGDLAQIWSLVCASDRFSQSESDYALPRPLFVFGEILVWHAQSGRSGAWTYYEATPTQRQDAMQRALEAIATLPLAHCYSTGMRNWREQQAMCAVDDWIRVHEHEIISWLRNLIRANRPTFVELVGEYRAK